MIRRPPRSTPLYSSAASDVYKRQDTILSSKYSVPLSDLAFFSDDADDTLNTPCLFRVSNSILSSESSLYEVFCFLIMFIELFKFTDLLNVQSFLEMLKHLQYYCLLYTSDAAD